MPDQKLNKVETNQGSSGATNQPNSAVTKNEAIQYLLTKQYTMQFN